MTESYRPQKKSIDPSEIESKQEAKDALDNMARVHEHVSQISQQGGEFGSVKIEGAIPPQAQARIQQKSAAKQVPRLSNDSVDHLANNKLLHGLLERAAQTTNIYERIELPSRGRFYNGDDGPTNGIVHMRRMVGQEEQILATQKYVKSGQAMDMIFNRVLQENQYRTENFISQDRTYMMIHLRGRSYTTNYEVEVKCTNCDRRFPTSIDLDMPVEYCPDDFNENSLRGELPDTKFQFSYRLATGRDEVKILEHRENSARGFDSLVQANDSLLFRTALLLKEIEGLTDKESLMALLKGLSVNDVNYLRNVVGEPPFGVKTKTQTFCPMCLEEFEIDLPFDVHFFFPRVRVKSQETQA